ncbi:MAG: hypothetical protein JWL80_150 [Parcubacteria group bacterium]|nr:hypothetical protein [Parcubacteria group bacterium]
MYRCFGCTTPRGGCVMAKPKKNVRFSVGFVSMMFVAITALIGVYSVIEGFLALCGLRNRYPNDSPLFILMTGFVILGISLGAFSYITKRWRLV